MGELGATCDYTFHDERTDLSKEAWDIKRVGQLCTESDNFTNWSSVITKFCADNKLMCTREIKKQVDNMAKKVDQLTKQKK